MASIVANVPGFRVEKERAVSVNLGGKSLDAIKTKTYTIEHTRERWYERFFWDKEHQNFVGKHDTLGAIALSLLKEKVVSSSEEKKYQYRAILWTKKGMLRCYFPKKSNKTADVFATIADSCELQRSSLNNLMLVQKEQQQKLSQDLLKIESMETSSRLIFGVIYGKDNQSAIEDMLLNEHGSETFNQLLDIIATKIDMNTFENKELTKFAGLTTKSDTATDGVSHAYYTEFDGFEIIFHVSTLLPYSATDAQQVARKRKIGNDIGVLIINEGSGVFTPSLASSKVNHVFGVMQLDKRQGTHVQYKFTTSSKDEVPSFGPVLQDDLTLFDDPAIFRSFILTKMINGVHSAYHNAPGFKREQTQEKLLDDLLNRYSSRNRWVSWSSRNARRRSVLISPAELNAGLCSACVKPITISDTGVSALGKSWHVSHFVCAHCETPFGTSPFIVNPQDNKPYCERDYEDLFCPRCQACEKPISDYVLQAMGKTWHMLHFVCDECQEPIGERLFVEKEGKAYCLDDFYKKFGFACARCSELITGEYIEALGKRWHTNCYTCCSCNKSIAGPNVNAMGFPWHPDCFCCQTCQKTFDDGCFFEHENKPYCEKHFYEITGSLCAKCLAPILDDQIVRALDRSYHAEHFCCSQCNKVIGDNEHFIEHRGDPYCQTCAVAFESST